MKDFYNISFRLDELALYLYFYLRYLQKSSGFDKLLTGTNNKTRWAYEILYFYAIPHV